MSEYIIRNLHVWEQTRTARSAGNSAIEDWVLICNYACISTSLHFCFFLSLCMNVCTIVQLYYDSLYVYILLFFALVILFFSEYPYQCSAILYVYMYVSSSVFISVFSLNASVGFQRYCHLCSVYIVVPWFVFLSMFLSVSVNAWITSNIACICVSLYPCFSLSFCLWMCIPVSEYIIIYSWCICTALDPCFCLSFSVIVYICVRLYCHWLYGYRYVSYSAFLSVFPSIFFNVRYIVDNLYVCEQACSSHSVCM